MRRTYGRERYLDLVARLREAIPDLSLTTDLIVGFPGETEDDFAQTLSLVEECRYDGAYTFLYSPRPGTEAHDTLPDDVRARGQARAHRPAGRGGAAHRRRAGGRGSSGTTARGAGRGPVAHRPVAPARPPAPEHHRQLHRDGGAGHAGAGARSTPRPRPPCRAARPASARRWPFPPRRSSRSPGRRPPARARWPTPPPSPWAPRSWWPTPSSATAGSRSPPTARGRRRSAEVRHHCVGDLALTERPPRPGSPARAHAAIDACAAAGRPGDRDGRHRPLPARRRSPTWRFPDEARPG